MAKSYDEATKKKVLAEKAKGKKTVEEICKEFGVSKQTLFKWQRKTKGSNKTAKPGLKSQDIIKQIHALKLQLADVLLQEV